MYRIILCILSWIVMSTGFPLDPLSNDMEYVEPYTEKYFAQYIDHFNFAGLDGKIGTYMQRYLVSDRHWKRGSGPILFYTGNEGDIVGFWENTGFLFELAEKLHGLVIFAEHRYYGKSLPFGEASFTNENIGFLSIEQALADYAVLVKALKKQLNATGSAVFAFGGSYGGILSGYMRYKYPHIITAAVASSAPFLTIAGHRPRYEFFQDVTKTFQKSDASCPNSVAEGFDELLQLLEGGDKSRKILEEIFHFCPNQMFKPDIVQHTVAWARNAFTLLAMMDYPYPTSFMAPLPGHPVDLSCKYMKQQKNKLMGLSNITDLLYGAPKPCHDVYAEYIACADPTGCGTGAAARAWDYQACTEMMLPGGSNNVTDMFPHLDFTVEMRHHYCAATYGLGKDRLEWLATEYWGSLEDIKEASHIIFPNGDLDPWGTGGVSENLSPTLIAILVEGGAHHLDLRASNPADPPSVTKARIQITNTLLLWMHEAHK